MTQISNLCQVIYLRHWKNEEAVERTMQPIEKTPQPLENINLPDIN